MQRRTLFVLGIVILLIAVALLAWLSDPAFFSTHGGTTNHPVACTLEAKICPDGSAVGRTGPNCEFAACPTATTTDTGTTSAGDITLGIGQKGSTGALTISLGSVGEDSRCPTDVQCIWAGSVTATTTLAIGTQTQIHVFSTTSAPYVFGQYQISVSSVTPTRVSGQTIAPTAYRITFHIVQLQ